MTIMEISVVPIGTGNTSLSYYVAECLEELKRREKELNYNITAMGTIVEGNLEDILELVRHMHEVPFKKGAQRVVTTLKIDDRRDMDASIEQKVSSVQQKIKSDW